jgi:hypothetical protein
MSAIAALRPSSGQACALPRAARPSTAVYPSRRPEKTVVYQVVQQNLETWLARVREAEPDRDPIPRFVERDLRKYLDVDPGPWLCPRPLRGVQA